MFKARRTNSKKCCKASKRLNTMTPLRKCYFQFLLCQIEKRICTKKETRENNNKRHDRAKIQKKKREKNRQNSYKTES